MANKILEGKVVFVNSGLLDESLMCYMPIHHSISTPILSASLQCGHYYRDTAKSTAVNMDL